MKHFKKIAVLCVAAASIGGVSAQSKFMRTVAVTTQSLEAESGEPMACISVRAVSVADSTVVDSVLNSSGYSQADGSTLAFMCEGAKCLLRLTPMHGFGEDFVIDSNYAPAYVAVDLTALSDTVDHVSLPDVRFRKIVE